jgi:hypothetical protein
MDFIGGMAVLLRFSLAAMRLSLSVLLIVCSLAACLPGIEERYHPDAEFAELGADYLVITSGELVGALAPLLDRRAADDLLVKLVTVDELADQAGKPFIGPEDLRGFLNNALLTWSIPPRYVLLVGDFQSPGSKIGDGGKQEAWIPTFIVESSSGLDAPSDVLFGISGVGEEPAMAIGRIPASDASVVGRVIKKILAYEDYHTGIDPKMLALVDGDDPHYSYDALLFYQALAPDRLFSLETLEIDDLTQMPPIDISGYDPVLYFGHGSLQQWGARRYLTSQDPKLLTKDDGYAVIFQWSCLTGYFIHPTAISLSEALLIAHEGKVAAIFAPTGLTDPSEQAGLFLALADAVKTLESGRLGDYLLYAQQRAYGESEVLNEIVETFVLLGDPAMKVNW